MEASHIGGWPSTMHQSPRSPKIETPSQDGIVQARGGKDPGQHYPVAATGGGGGEGGRERFSLLRKQ